MQIYPVILAGGSGTRLWSLSRKNSPKQFLKINQNINLLQETVLRIADSNIFFPPVIICNHEQRWQTEDSLKKINIDNYKLIIEPYFKNTAPAITATTLLLKQNNALILAIPVDHYIKNKNDFISDIMLATEVAKNFLVTFGIKCTYPSISYGYIKKGGIINNSELYKVNRFIEKPKYEIAKSFYAQGYLWNSGIFLFNPNIYLNEVAQYAPLLLNHSNKAVTQAKIDQGVYLLEPIYYNKCDNISIDHAIMEKTKRLAVLPSKFDWIDVGNFSSLHQMKSKGKNFIDGKGLFLESKNCYIHSKDLFTAVVGLKNVSVISAKDSVLVLNNDKAEEVKKVVQYLEKDNEQELLNGMIEHRPWGYYENLTVGKGYKIKRIVVNSKSKLSLQSHEHRAEQWTVIKGKARVTLNDQVFDLVKNESTYIPLGAKHRLQNCQDEPLEIIEIQLGEYLEESDIKRYDDIYGRHYNAQKG